jgi:adenylyl-sulfate kinase
MVTGNLMPQAQNITWHHGAVTHEQRANITRARPTILWLTGLSGCGKSTLAMALEHKLIETGHAAYVLDGDNIRHGLNKNLGFSPEDRQENIRRIGEVAKLFADAGMVAIASFISPYRADRAGVRALVKPGEFVEVYVDAPLEVCEARDAKGLYKKARSALADGKGLMFTGIDAPYEAPSQPEIHVHTDRMPVDACVQAVIDYLKRHGRLVEGAR